MTGPIPRCNARVELTVTEFLRLDRMPSAKHAVPARLHCELEHQHDGDHVAFAQAGEGAYSDTAKWWIRWNAAGGTSPSCRGASRRIRPGPGTPTRTTPRLRAPG